MEENFAIFFFHLDLRLATYLYARFLEIVNVNKSVNHTDDQTNDHRTVTVDQTQKYKAVTEEISVLATKITPNHSFNDSLHTRYHKDTNKIAHSIGHAVRTKVSESQF